MKLCIAILAGLIGTALPTLAEDDKPNLDIDLHTRASFLNDRVGNDIRHDASGFKGEYLLLIVNGQVNDRISFSWRQRLNQKIDRNDAFDATDWLYVDYNFDDHWNVAAGKQPVMIGGYEYDRSPIDIYTPSEFWNNIPCFQFSASVSYAIGNSRFSAQVSQSPFHRPSHRDMLAYSLHWAGHYGWLKTLYSLNMVEYSPQHFISYIALGNRFEVGKTSLELDFMNRATSHQTYLLKDCSVMARLGYRPIPHLGLYGKFTYDVNRTHVDADQCVLPGTELTAYGGEVEYYPLNGKPDVRVSLGVSHSTGCNSNTSGTVLDNQTIVRLGLTAKLHLLSWKKQ